MKPILPRIARALAPVMSWLGKNFGPAKSTARLKYESDWDYAQADLQPWDAEPDTGRLSAALDQCRIDPHGGFASLSELAKDGSRVAMNTVGERYYWGVVVSKSANEGEAWFKKAYERGSHRGLLNYGKALITRGEFERAAEVFREGVGKDLAPAYYWLARAQAPESRTLRSVRSSLPLLERAVELGSPAAKSALSALMAVGFFGVRHIPRGIHLAAGELDAAEE